MCLHAPSIRAVVAAWALKCSLHTMTTWRKRASLSLSSSPATLASGSPLPPQHSSTILRIEPSNKCVLGMALEARHQQASHQESRCPHIAILGCAFLKKKRKWQRTVSACCCSIQHVCCRCFCARSSTSRTSAHFFSL